MSRLALALLIATGCGGTSKDAKGPDPLDDKLGGLVVPRVDASLCDAKGKRVETYDLDRDNEPDVWKVFATVKERGVETEVMTCKQVDFDHDGVKDYVVTYRETGQMTSEEADLTFDGRFDSRHHFDKKSNKLYLIERDTDHDKKPDVWEKYGDDAKIESVRRDTNADGKPDIWEQYIKGELVAILYDDDFDNRVDRKEQVKVERRPLAKTPDPPRPEPEPEAPESNESDEAPSDEKKSK